MRYTRARYVSGVVITNSLTAIEHYGFKKRHAVSRVGNIIISI